MTDRSERQTQSRPTNRGWPRPFLPPTRCAARHPHAPGPRNAVGPIPARRPPAPARAPNHWFAPRAPRSVPPRSSSCTAANRRCANGPGTRNAPARPPADVGAGCTLGAIAAVRPGPSRGSIVSRISGPEHRLRSCYTPSTRAESPLPSTMPSALSGARCQAATASRDRGNAPFTRTARG